MEKPFIHPSLLENLILIEEGKKIVFPISGEKADELGRILFTDDERESA